MGVAVSVRIMTQVWEIRLPDSEKLVLLALADCANDEGQCWPSMATLAKKCSKSDRTVQASIKALVAAGHLTRMEVLGKGCRYVVHPTPEAASPPKRLPPEKASPPKGTTPTPEAASDKPSRTITSPVASPPPRTRGGKIKPFRLPEDWKPDRFADGTVARAVIDRRGREWALAAIEAFRNWAANAADRDGIGRKTDWQKAWANWVIEQDKRDGRHGGSQRVAGNDGRGGSASGMGPTVDAARRFLARRGLGEHHEPHSGG